MHLTNCLIGGFNSKNFSTQSIDEFNALFDPIPLAICWKDTKGRYLGRNRYAAEQMVMHNIEVKFDLNIIKMKTDFDIFTYETAKAYRDNDLIVMQDPHRVHYFVESCVLPGGEQIEQISVKCGIFNPSLELLGVLACMTNINKHLQADKSLHEIIKTEAVVKFRTLLVKYIASKNATQYKEIYKALLDIIHLNPKNHELHQLLLLNSSESHTLCLLLKDISFKQLASILNVPVNMIEIHLVNIRKKLNLSSKLNVADWFWQILSEL